ncbi:hypothetical protein ABH922_001499 [Rhodococcus sp. 27YEA15]|uniref:hypothetical protein n=1 Tax=Rhodococcus sp. 27YEA15 TaxID=3156259 RepID=UPI003C7C8C17
MSVQTCAARMRRRAVRRTSPTRVLALTGRCAVVGSQLQVFLAVRNCGPVVRVLSIQVCTVDESWSLAGYFAIRAAA